MAYTVSEAKSVKKEVAKLQKKVRESYNNWKDNDLTQDPENACEGVVQKFKMDGLVVRKKRFGQYRALYAVNQTNNSVLIFKFDGRDDVYD